MQKKRKINLPAAASFWYTAANLISRGAIFIFTPIFTRLLTPKEYGTYFLYSGWLTVFSVIASPVLSGSITYRALAEVGEERFAPSALGASATFNLLFVLIYLALRPWINSVTGLTTPLTLLLMFHVLLSSVWDLYFAKERYAYRYRRISLVRVGTGILSPLLALAFIKGLSIKAEGRIFAEVLLALAAALPMALSIIRGKRLFDGYVWAYIFKTCILMLPHFLSHALLGQGEKLMVSRLLGEGALGEYSLAHTAGFLVNLALGGLSVGIAPWIARKKSEGESSRVRDAVATICFTATALTLCYLTVLPEVFKVIASKRYFGALRATYPVAVGATFAFINGSLTSILLYSKQAGKITAISVFSAIFSLGVGYIMISAFGYIGAGITTAISYLFSAVLSYHLARKYDKESLPSQKQATSLIILVIGFGALAYFLREVLLARIILLLALVLLAAPRVIGARRLLLEKKSP